MSVTSGLCNSFKQEILQAVHDFDNDTIKLALYTDDATLSPATTVYTVTNETSGSGYTAGGKTITPTIALADGVAYIDFGDVSWTGASFNFRNGLIYNSSKSDKAIAVLDFGMDFAVTSSVTVQFPEANANMAMIRIV